MYVCACARGCAIADEGAIAGARTCARSCEGVHVPACVSECVGAHASALDGARSRTCGRVCVGVRMIYHILLSNMI